MRRLMVVMVLGDRQLEALIVEGGVDVPHDPFPGDNKVFTEYIKTDSEDPLNTTRDNNTWPSSMCKRSNHHMLL